MRLFEQLNKIEEESLISFHVPGHKYHPLMASYFDGKLLEYDVTEFHGTDDLHEAETCIKSSQEAAKEFYKSKQTYFLVNGTTSGIYSMIMAVTEPNDTILVARDCHKAVYNAAILGHLKTQYIKPEYFDSIPLGISLESAKAAIDENPNAKALILTYPNYYGVGCPLAEIIEYAHKNDVFVLVDEAHGAHLCLSDRLMPSAVELGADIVVQSSHKSLPVMTQASMLHLISDTVNQDKLEVCLAMHQSSSPSYILMASLDIGLSILMDVGHERMTRLLATIDEVKKAPYYLVDSDLPTGFSLDPTKLVLMGSKSNFDPLDVEVQLRKSGIQLEFSNENHGVFVSSIMNEYKDFDKLMKTLEMLKFKCYSGISNVEYGISSPTNMSLSEAFYSASESVELNQALNRISKHFITPYPPGIPLLVPGEIIGQECIDIINNMITKKIKINGIKHHCLEVIL